MQVFRTELRFSTKADIFYSDTAVLKIHKCCHTICDWSAGVSGRGLPDNGGGAILEPTVFDVTHLYGESRQSCT